MTMSKEELIRRVDHVREWSVATIRESLEMAESCLQGIEADMEVIKMNYERITNAKAGDRIELVKMVDDPDPIAAGTQGTVKWVNDLGTFQQIDVEWDNGRTLMLTVPSDEFVVLDFFVTQVPRPGQPTQRYLYGPMSEQQAIGELLRRRQMYGESYVVDAVRICSLGVKV